MKNQFPPGWNEDRVRRVLDHYENQDELEAIAEDEMAFEAPGQTVMSVPKQLVPEITQLIARRRARRASQSAVRRRRRSKSRA